MTTRYVRIGYRLNDKAIPVPANGRLAMEYSVDPWFTPPYGYVIFDHDGVEHVVPEADLARFGVMDLE